MDEIGTTSNNVYTKEIGFKYNANGIRVEKEEVATNTKTQYFLDGTNIIAQKKISSNETTLTKFIYGVDGITGFEIGDKLYTYKKNLQGDIIGIYDEKTQIVEYFYDAWGKCYVFDGTNYIDILIIKDYNIDSNNNLCIALKNPYLYRGYYFDIETGLYYLNSRYYDPETGRFISIDDISILSEAKDLINGLNLYAYCSNNPVIYTDDSGNAWWHWLIGVAVILTSVALTVITAGGFAGAATAIMGAVGWGGMTAVGGAAGFFANVTAGILVSTAIGVVSSGISSLINKTNFFEEVSKGFMWGTIFGLVSGAFGFLKFDGFGNIFNRAGTKIIGNKIQVAGQSVIAEFVYLARTLVENEQLSISGVILSFASGFVGGYLSNVVQSTQRLIASLFETASLTLQIIKRN